MSSLPSYTPLETLVFFQSLLTSGTTTAAFARISDSLKANKFVRDSPSFDIGRLSPDALQILFHTLVREEKKQTSDSTQLSSDGQAALSPESRKRKLSSLSDEATSYATIVPGLVTRLYASYRSLIVKEIQDDEDKYRSLTVEAEKLDAGNTNFGLDDEGAQAVLAKGGETEVHDSKILDGSPKATVATADASKTSKDPSAYAASDRIVHTPTVSSTTDHAREDRGNANQRNESREALWNYGSSTSPRQAQNSVTRPTSRPEPISPVSRPASFGHSGPTQVHQHQHAPQQSPINGTQPFLPPPHQSGRGYRLMSPGHGSPTRSHPPQQLPNPMNPAMSPGRTLPPPQQSANGGRSPVILPPPPGVKFNSAPSPVQHNSPDMGRQYQQPQMSQMSRMQHMTPGQPGQNHAQAPQDRYQAYPQYPGPSSRYPSQGSPYAATPYNASLQNPNRGLPMPHQSPYGHDPQARAMQYSPQQGAAPTIARATPENHGLGLTPGSRPAPLRELQTYTPIQRTGVEADRFAWGSDPSKRLPHAILNRQISSTPWKRTSKVSTETPRSPTRPTARDVSPISDRAASPASDAEPSVDEQEAEKTEGRPPKRGPAVPAKKTRKQTSAREQDRRSASQQVLSRESIGASDTSSQHPTDQGRISRAGEKRKRNQQETTEEPETVSSRATPVVADSTQVMCTRNFSRISVPVMDSITAHKYASLFAKPITKKDAPGYQDLIFRPQDLKSIKTAINSGSRAVASALETTGTPAGESSPGAATWLPRAPELTPPKGIVNSSQLEAELMRIFANAVMFNPDPQRGFGPAFVLRHDNDSDEESDSGYGEEGGVIKDARDMSEAVEKTVAEWRSAERPY